MDFAEKNGFVPKFTIMNSSRLYSSLYEAVHDCSDRTLNFSALNVFFRSGFFLGETTPFKAVRQYSPAPAILPINNGYTREQAVSGFVDVFREAVERLAIHQGTALGLSGGRDSRHIVLELARIRRLPDYAVTVDLPGLNDAEVARDLCTSLGIRHLVVPAERSSKSARWTCKHTNLMSLQHAWFAGVASRRDERAWWDGIGGDVLSAGLFLEPWNLALVRRCRFDELADRLTLKGPIPFFRDQSLFPRMDAVEMVRRELIRHESAANPIGSFYFWNRTRRDIAASAFAMLRPAGQLTLAPYLEEDVFSHLASIPAEHFLDHRFHDEAIALAHPHFAESRYSAKRLDARPSLLEATVFALEVLRGIVSSRTVTRFSLLTRALRTVIQPSCRKEIEWLRPLAAYLAELEEFGR